jgi:non-ribosomal peptide synthetase component F
VDGEQLMTLHRQAATSLPALFEQQAATTGTHIAVTHENTHLTYRELNSRANQLSRILIHHGVGPGCVVALAVPRESFLDALGAFAGARLVDQERLGSGL